jgi:TPR repeat protein
LLKAASAEAPTDEQLLKIARPSMIGVGWQSLAIDWIKWTYNYATLHALYEIRTTYLSFNGLADSQEAANLALEAYAQAGYRDAMRDLGRRLRRGRRGFRRVPSTALMWLKKASAAGDRRSMSEAAEMLLESKLPDDQTEALRLATATQQIPQSKYLLGVVCAEGLAGRRKDEQKAVEWFAQAASGGSKRAKTRLGCKACSCVHVPIMKRGTPSVPDVNLGPRINKTSQLEFIRRLRRPMVHGLDNKTTSFTGSHGAVFAVRLRSNGSPTHAAQSATVCCKFVSDDGELKVRTTFCS